MDHFIKVTMKERQFLWLTLFYLHLSGACAEEQCATLIPGANQILSQTEAVVNGHVTVSCEPGYVLDTMVLSNQIQCLMTSSTPEWNNGLGSCILKKCPPLNFDTNTQVSAPTELDIGIQVTVTCVEGTALTSDLTTGQMTLTQTIICEDDPNDVYGAWDETVGNCTEIQCSAAPDFSNSFSNNTGNPAPYGASVQYTCYSGHILADAYAYSTIGTCNATAEWSFEDDLYPECLEINGYLGCFDANSVNKEVAFTTSDISTCVYSCQSSSFRFAAISGTTCTCGNDMNSSVSIASKSDCDNPCVHYSTDVSVSTTDVYCGGNNQEQTVFATLDGCLETGSIDMSSATTIEGAILLTCKERCRGVDSTHAALLNKQCLCLNSTEVPNTFVGHQFCTDGSGNSSYVTVHDLALTTVSADSCEELYSKGVMMQGRYYLKDQPSTVFCHFKDGTICEDGWIGYNGNCYYFEKTEAEIFNTSLANCRSYGGDLVSILTTAESDFVTDTIKRFYELEDIKDWYVGLVDIHHTDFYTWTDASKPTFSPFHSNEPNSEGLYCSTAHKKHNYQLQDFSCDLPAAYICKRPSGATATSDCLYITDVGWTAAATVDLESMTLTFCMEFCRGQGLGYALVNSTECRCSDSLPSHVEQNKVVCSEPCPGNNVQSCGGGTTAVDRVTVRNVANLALASSCEELQLLGMGGFQFALLEGGNEVIRHCDVPQCDFAWIAYGSHCYKFPPLSQSTTEARKTCSKLGGYLIVADTSEETEALVEIAANISLYKSFERWRTGLAPLSSAVGTYRWSNGKIFQSPVWNDSMPVPSLKSLLLKKGNPACLEYSTQTDERSICEKGKDFLGCYNGSDLHSDVNITDYSLMTIQQCVELCRGQGSDFAYIGTKSCVCGDAELSDSKSDDCIKPCSGDRNQPCGGNDDTVSVYNISAYEAFAGSCEDLFDASIYVAGDYVINGSVQHCDFLDGTSCSDGWVGYEGECYSFIKDNEITQTSCKNRDGEFTSLTNLAEYNFIISYLKGNQLFNTNGFVATGVVDFTDLGSLTSVDGLLTDPTLLQGGQIPQLLTSGHHAFNTSLHLGKAGDLEWGICKENKRSLGCYTSYGLMAPVLEDYGSMEWTLCKQLCLGQGSTVAMVSLDSCYCGTEDDLSGLTTATSGCTVACPGHDWQYCGNGSVYIAQKIEATEAARDCDTLYLHGVFVQADYLLQNDTSYVVTYRQETCGFSDHTRCPPFWIGFNGTCFRFYTKRLSRDDARELCFRENGYLLVPTGDLVNEFIQNMTSYAYFFKDISRWLTGINTVFYNTTYLSPHGDMLDLTYLNNTNIPDTATLYDVTDNTWTESGVTEDTYNFICQTNKGYQGCGDVLNQTTIFLHNIPDMSVTYCAEFCRGQDGHFFGTSHTSCACFTSVPDVEWKYGSCMTSCPGNRNQPCGGTKDNGDPLYSCFILDEVRSRATSCDDLFRYGIWRPGLYELNPDFSQAPMKSVCFNHREPFGTIPYDDVVLHSSVSKSGYDVSMARLEYPLTQAWMPETSSAYAYLKVVFSEHHVITGLGISGMHSSSSQAWVTSARLKYLDGVSSELVTFTVEPGSSKVIGNVNGIDVTRRFFPQPFVTLTFFLYPDEWHSDIALNVEVYGQRFKYFNHSEVYVGCYPVLSNSFINVGSVSDCQISCETSNYTFSGSDNAGNCYCGNNIGKHGYVQDEMCSMEATDYIAVNRTFALHCELPTQTPVHGNVLHEHHPFTSSVYTVYSSVEYTCDTGYEFDDGTTSPKITCKPDREWTVLEKVCQKISCPPFPTVENGNVSVTSTEYLGEATVTCNHGYWLPGSVEELTVTCMEDKTWSNIPSCRPENLKESQRLFSIQQEKVRINPTVSEELHVRGPIDCAAKCTSAYYCKGANYKITSEPDRETNCRLFNDLPSASDLQDDTEWHYYETNGPI